MRWTKDARRRLAQMVFDAACRISRDLTIEREEWRILEYFEKLGFKRAVASEIHPEISFSPIGSPPNFKPSRTHLFFLVPAYSPYYFKVDKEIAAKVLVLGLP